MRRQAPSYHGYRFPAEIISHTVWLCHRFCLSFRDVEDLLAQRGVVGRHLLGAVHDRALRTRWFRVWDEVTCAC